MMAKKRKINTRKVAEENVEAVDFNFGGTDG